MAVGGFSLEVPAPLRDRQRRLAALLSSVGPSAEQRVVPPGQVAGRGSGVGKEMRHWWFSSALLPTAGRAHIHSAGEALLLPVRLGLSPLRSPAPAPARFPAR